LELRRGQKKYRWYGESVGDSPLPRGVAVSDLGKCEHAVSIPGDKTVYEIGLVLLANGSYQLHYDEFNGGYGLQAKVGRKAGLLLQRYGLNAAANQARKQGMTVRSETVLPDGRIRLVCEPRQQFAQAGGGQFVGSGF